MSNLVSFGILNEKVNKIFVDQDCESKGNAFMRFALSSILKLNDEEIEESITDGPDDGEVDAIYIDKRDVHILTFKYTDEFEFTKKNFPGTDIDQFSSTIEHIISADLDKKTINPAVWEKYQEIRTLSKDGRVNFKIYVISNKLHPVDSSKRKIGRIVQKYKLIENPFHFNQEDIVSTILEHKVKK